MRMFFENPEMTISLFENENVVTTVSDGTALHNAYDAVNNGTITFAGVTTETAKKATTIIQFTD